MTLKQRLLEGILVGVVGGLVATAIGGVGVLAYTEMVASKDQLKETTKFTRQLNDSSITSIDRLAVVDESISSLITRINKLEEENGILSRANSANGEAIKLLSEALKRATFTNQSEANAKIKQAAGVAGESSKKLERLSEITLERAKIRTQQQQQQIQLESYRNTQQRQQKQQQLKKW